MIYGSFLVVFGPRSWVWTPHKWRCLYNMFVKELRSVTFWIKLLRMGQHASIALTVFPCVSTSFSFKWTTPFSCELCDGGLGWKHSGIAIRSAASVDELVRLEAANLLADAVAGGISVIALKELASLNDTHEILPDDAKLTLPLELQQVILPFLPPHSKLVPMVRLLKWNAGCVAHKTRIYEAK